jgi:hypothetical protein
MLSTLWMAINAAIALCLLSLVPALWSRARLRQTLIASSGQVEYPERV